ncbi:hypothetical protein LSTR_LSTR009350 [Laodelphax striatellus]|uniref:Uncharacterized protein n=1 Tax=Laodelphax striatellus TaxID=195883 RepID=A0A482XJ00_LAOST|nr:hypothetical protein LSTR_LSTR009350 [Laodelphax striatellus]
MELENYFWSPQAKLFQPPKEQLLLPDHANCLFMQTYLTMCGLKFEIVHRHNVEHMSPTERIPFLVCENRIISENDALIGYVESIGESLTHNLEFKHKQDLQAYMSLVRTTLENAELYLTWYHHDFYKNFTWTKYSLPYPWPLNYVLTYSKRKRIIKRLAQMQWRNKTIEQVYEDVENCFKSLSALLGRNNYLIGNQPTEIDALVFAHVHAALGNSLVADKYCEILVKYQNIVEHYKLVGSRFRFSTKKYMGEAGDCR